MSSADCKLERKDHCRTNPAPKLNPNANVNVCMIVAELQDLNIAAITREAAMTRVEQGNPQEQM